MPILKRYFIVAIILSAISAGSALAAIEIGQTRPQPPVIAAIMKRNLPVVQPMIAPDDLRPFLRLIDADRRVSFIMPPPVEGVVDMRFEFAQEPILWVYFSRVENSTSTGVGMIYGFHRYYLLSGEIETIYENRADEPQAINSFADFSIDQSIGGGRLLFTDPVEQIRYLLDTNTGELRPLLALSDLPDVLRMWWSPDRTSFAHIQNGHLVIRDSYGAILRDFPEIELDTAHTLSWMDGGASLLITTFTEPSLPNFYIDAQTGETVDEQISDIDGYRLRFRNDCDGGRIVTYTSSSQNGLRALDLDTGQDWSLVPSQFAHATNAIDLLTGCQYVLIYATTPTGQHLFLYELESEDLRLLRENVHGYRQPDRDGNYTYNELLGNGRVRIYSANIHDDSPPELVREMPDLSHLRNLTVADDRVYHVTGASYRDMRLAVADMNGQHMGYLTPVNERVEMYRYFELGEETETAP